MATKTVSSVNDWLTIDVADVWDRNQSATVMIEISGTFVGAITLQWRLASETDGDYRDVPNGRYQAPAAELLRVKEDANNGWLMRAGFKTGDYTSGSAKLVIL